MRLPFSRSTDDPAVAGDDAVQLARTRARRRLVGALVLLVAGVIGFPLVFETQPRPLPADTTIVVPPRAAPLPARVGPRPPPRPVPPEDVVAEVPQRPAEVVAAAPQEPRSGGAAVAAPASVPASGKAAAHGDARASGTPNSVVAVASTPIVGGPATPAREATPAPRAVASGPSGPTGPAAHASSTAATAAASAAGRFVVQVGAYTDAATLREARARVERLGLRTYTQVIESDSGKRTRVRVGPFATRDEAAAAARKLQAAGLPHNLLAL